MVNLSARL